METQSHPYFCFVGSFLFVFFSNIMWLVSKHRGKNYEIFLKAFPSLATADHMSFSSVTHINKHFIEGHKNIQGKLTKSKSVINYCFLPATWLGIVVIGSYLFIKRTGLNVSQQNLCSKSDYIFWIHHCIYLVLLYNRTACNGRERYMYADHIHGCTKTNFYEALLLFWHNESENGDSISMMAPQEPQSSLQ